MAKRYVALLTQSSTDAPVVTELENTLGGTVVPAYSAVGVYTLTLTGAFTSAKTVCRITNNKHADGWGEDMWVLTIDRTDADTITIKTSLIDINGAVVTPANGLLTATPIEILVYA